MRYPEHIIKRDKELNSKTIKAIRSDDVAFAYEVLAEVQEQKSRQEIAFPSYHYPIFHSRLMGYEAILSTYIDDLDTMNALPDTTRVLMVFAAGLDADKLCAQLSRATGHEVDWIGVAGYTVVQTSTANADATRQAIQEMKDELFLLYCIEKWVTY